MQVPNDFTEEGLQMEPQKEVSVLIGGRAGDGISSSGLLVAHLLGKLGYRIYMYFDYPSLVKGGHNFAIVRASARPIGAVRDRVDFVLAINQDTIRFHEPLFHEGTVIIYNADTVKSGGIGVKVDEILKSESGLPVMGNSCMIGAFARAAGIEWAKVEVVFRKSIPKMVDLNLRVARRAYEGTPDVRAVTPVPQATLPVLSGDEAIGLGLVQSGLESYFSYPMSPTSDILHFLAAGAENFRIRAIQPESETAAILMALGCAYAGKRAAVGTSGGGFCLMAESLGLAGMAELPVVIAIGQRPGPSTGLATYTAQSDLHFILNASQGEFPRFIAAPGNAEEAYFWSTAAMELAWKYQVPAFILADKTVCEGMYSFFREGKGEYHAKPSDLPQSAHPYLRYAHNASGVSPLAFPPQKGEVIKVNSHTHDEAGITTEEPDLTKAMADKRWKKMEGLAAEVDTMEAVIVLGNPDAESGLLCWGSNKGVCEEVAETFALRVVQPVVLSPFPEQQFREALSGVTRLVAVELNETGQLARLIRQYGFPVHDRILKYDGRPFSVEALEEEVRKVLA